MFDSLSDRAGETVLRAIYLALDECKRLKTRWVCSEHLLFGLAHEDDQGGSIAQRALSSMNVSCASVSKELEGRLEDERESEPLFSDRPEGEDIIPARAIKSAHPEIEGKPAFSQESVEAIRKAREYSLFFGQEELEPEHLLLAIMDLKESGASRIFEELGANLTFLRRQVIQMMAHESFTKPNFPGLYTALKQGLSELVERYNDSVRSLSDLAVRGKQPLIRLPARSQITQMIVVGYMSEFLATQVCFQRYLLEESLRNLVRRSGAIDKELLASIVSSAAQNLRAEVRQIIEHMWCNEYQILTKMLDDAEHDLIGSVIEDLWWCHSEEIALHDLFSEALDDHRRSHLLSLQKRRIELSERLEKLRARLDDTINQCFINHSISA